MFDTISLRVKTYFAPHARALIFLDVYLLRTNSLSNILAYKATNSLFPLLLGI